MNLTQPIIAELQLEAATTRKMLERVPVDSLAWKPHEKSWELGKLAAHIAHLPGLLITALKKDELNAHESRPPAADNVSEILAAFDRNISGGLEVLRMLSDEQMLTSWRYKYGEQVVFEMPRLAVMRAVGLNHMIHHRGQLSVYLRLLGVPLPPVYGPTADEAAL